MATYFQQLGLLYEHHPIRLLLAIAAGVLLGALLFWLFVRGRKPSQEEIERRRRDRLTELGRITDGYLLDARTLHGEESVSPTPEVLLYGYKLAGVTYNCAQDVSMLPELIRGYRLDEPIQVRYDPRNPGDSIIAAENWSGLWRTGRE